MFFFNDTATTEIYTLSLHDALPISYGRGILGALIGAMTPAQQHHFCRAVVEQALNECMRMLARMEMLRSEEHTSELQSRQYLVCRLLLEKKNISSFIFYASTSLPRM